MKKLLLFISLLHLTCITSTAQVTTMAGDSLFQKATTLINKNNQEEALQLALQEIDNTFKNPIKNAQWLVLTGNIFYTKNEAGKALTFYKRAHKINTELKDSLALMQDHIKIGMCFHHKFNNHYDERYEKPATKLKDSATFHYRKNLVNFNNIKNGLFYKAQSHNNLSIILSDIDSLNKALFHAKKAINIYKSKFPNKKNDLKKAINNKGLIYIYQKNYTAAKKVYSEQISKLIDTSNTHVLDSKITALNNLSYIYEQMKDYKKAYEYSEEFHKLSEILQEKQKALEITEIEAKYNEDKARAEEKINTAKVEKEKERTQYLLAATGVASLIIILFGTVLFRNSKLKAKNLSLSLIEQELTQQKELQHLQVQNQSKVLNATLDGREKERKDIAQTLHDSVSALLSSANMHLQVIKKKVSTEIDEIEKSQRIINEASDKVRDLSHKLISAVLLKFGLEHAVYDMCEKYSNDALLLELESEEKIPRFEQIFEIKMHNIIEEFINNIMKHSKATEATINLLHSNNTLYINIKDNGVGFDPIKLKPKAGIGLSQIKARIESMEGDINIKSQPNKGTTISIEVPVVNINS